MFSTPQSKAFFSQQIIKEKLITQQITLTTTVHQKIWHAKTLITEVIKILWQPQTQLSQAKKKLQIVIDILQNNIKLLSQSNQMFSFQVSLREDIKVLQHNFFKHIMHLYQEKIKELKKNLLTLQHDVQQLQQMGHLPYVQAPKKNNVLMCKPQFHDEYLTKVNVIETIIENRKKGQLEKLIISLIQNIIHKKQQIQIQQQQQKIHPIQKNIKYDQNGKQILDISEFIQEQGSEKIKNNIFISQNNYHQKNNCYVKFDIYQMLNILHNWTTICNFKIAKTNKSLKSKIQALNNSNKALKQSISSYKKIISYESQQSKIRQGSIQLTREQAIDFLREMDQDLQNRFNRRNIYMIISTDQQQKKSKTCTNIIQQLYDGKNHSTYHKQIEDNLNDSFLQKCGYLISDTFIADDNEVDNQIVIV